MEFFHKVTRIRFMAVAEVLLRDFCGADHRLDRGAD